ncbi:hypothetical protein HK102_009231 [Quaeritorhiza haematococci]|nr:hypothetical protein HK102_009231 [Quaeritorhiza haematococci]
MTQGNFFPTIAKSIPYEGPDTTNPLAFKWYNKDEIILGKKRPWETDDVSGRSRAAVVEACKRRVDAAFEFFQKLGVDFYTFHDRDVAPEGSTLEETNTLLDEVTDYMLLKQKETGIKLLWGTANLFSHPRYANGAATNPDVHVFAYAAAQVKKAMEVTHKLGGAGYVFWGGREGYQSLLNTDLRKELDHLAAFFKMAIAHKTKIGATFQFYIEPKPREPTKHQVSKHARSTVPISSFPYDYDAQTVMGFLHHYGLTDHFKLNIEPNHTTLSGHQYDHDIKIAAAYKMLGSIDCNTGDELLGWDTDQFLTDDRRATTICQTVIDMGGFTTGGLNFDAKVRRESTDLEDIFIAHIGSMDTFALGLRHAANIIESGRLPKMLSSRYESWNTTDEGKRIELGKSSFEELDQYVKTKGGENLVHAKSGKQGKVKSRVR